MDAEARCPACRARMAEHAVCGRCGCDLTLARRAQSQARAAIAQALRAWADDAPARAHHHVRSALALDDTALGRALLRVLDHAAPGQPGSPEGEIGATLR